MKSPDSCPNCGADLRPNTRVCPECGSDEKTGWSEDAYASGLNLPDEDGFNYDEFVEKEFGDNKEVKPRGIRWVWWIVAALLIAAFLLYFFVGAV